MAKSEKKMLQTLVEKGDKISKAEKLELLLKLEKKLLFKKMKMVDFKEPIMFFKRRNGDLEFYQNVTTGKFVFTHSDGKTRWTEIRPIDQLKFKYGDNRVRCYFGDEDRPFTGVGDGVVDAESIATMVDKINATKMKYEESLSRQQTRKLGKWVMIIFAIAGALAGIIFALGTWGGPIFEAFRGGSEKAVSSVPNIPDYIIPLLNAKIFK